MSLTPVPVPGAVGPGTIPGFIDQNGIYVTRQLAANGLTGISAFDAAGVNQQKVNADGQANVSIAGQKTTYSVVLIGFVPVAAATDIVGMIGSATKKVRLSRISVSGIATANGILDFVLLKRSTANTAGGSTITAATAVPHDSGDTAATAVVSSYSVANPTTGTLVGNVRADAIMLAKADGTGANPARMEWDFSTRNEKPLILNGIAQMLCLNLNGQTIPAGIKLDISLTFEESAD